MLENIVNMTHTFLSLCKCIVNIVLMNKADERLQKAAGQLQGVQATVEQLREQAIVLDLAQVLVRDMDSRIVQWNLGAERLYGFSKAEALGRISHCAAPASGKVSWCTANATEVA
jgi:PAS domain-containing protein